MHTEWEIPDFDYRLFNELKTGAYPNVYLGKPEQSLVPMCKTYQLGVRATKELIADSALAGDSIIRELLGRSRELSIEKECDVYVIRSSTQPDYSTNTSEFRLLLLLLGDVETGYYYDPHIGEVRYNRYDQDI